MTFVNLHCNWSARIGLTSLISSGSIEKAILNSSRGVISKATTTSAPLVCFVRIVCSLRCLYSGIKCESVLDRSATILRAGSPQYSLFRREASFTILSRDNIFKPCRMPSSLKLRSGGIRCILPKSELQASKTSHIVHLIMSLQTRSLADL